MMDDLEEAPLTKPDEASDDVLKVCVTLVTATLRNASRFEAYGEVRSGDTSGELRFCRRAFNGFMLPDPEKPISVGGELRLQS
jgi:hypothetical protein